MILEIYNQFSQLDHEHCIRIITSVKDWEISISKDDIIKQTDTGMLRIVRPNGNVTAVNPDHIVLTCILNKRSLLL